MVAATQSDALLIKHHYPQFKMHVVLTPKEPLSGFRVNAYVWTPQARALPARTRLELRGALSVLIDERSDEEEFPETLLSW